jgi:hypothetical protein
LARRRRKRKGRKNKQGPTAAEEFAALWYKTQTECYDTQTYWPEANYHFSDKKSYFHSGVNITPVTQDTVLVPSPEILVSGVSCIGVTMNQAADAIREMGRAMAYTPPPPPPPPPSSRDWGRPRPQKRVEFVGHVFKPPKEVKYPARQFPQWRFFKRLVPKVRHWFKQVRCIEHEWELCSEVATNWQDVNASVDKICIHCDFKRSIRVRELGAVPDSLIDNKLQWHYAPTEEVLM